jgi:hypothetical protein
LPRSPTPNRRVQESLVAAVTTVKRTPPLLEEYQEGRAAIKSAASVAAGACHTVYSNFVSTLVMEHHH